MSDQALNTLTAIVVYPSLLGLLISVPAYFIAIIFGKRRYVKIFSRIMFVCGLAYIGIIALNYKLA